MARPGPSSQAKRPRRLAAAALVAAVVLLAACSSGSATRATTSGTPGGGGALGTFTPNSGATASGIFTRDGSAPDGSASNPLASDADRAPAPASLVKKVSSIPVSALVAARTYAGNHPSLLAHGPKPIDTPRLNEDGKPLLVYFGGEFCPYCAADRWVTVLALAQFGQWHNLKVTRSSSSDIDPNTATFSFHGATYTSDQLAFAGYEITDRAGKPLDAVPKKLQSLPDTVSKAIHDSSFNATSIPFLDVGGAFVQSGAPYDPSILANLSWQEVAAELQRSNSTVGRTVLANAAELVHDLCTLTGDQPAKVCHALR